MKKPKSTTSSGKKEGNLRKNSKYPALNKGVNLSSRRDYIEPTYINGVIDEDGNMVIRALTDEEKAYLNQFYEETIVTNFLHDDELRKLNKVKRSIIEDSTVKDLMKEVKELNEDKETNKRRIRELKEIIKITKKQNEEIYADKLAEIEEELQELREEKLLYPDTNDHKTFYNHNNSRNNCIFNKMRSMGKLVFLDSEEYDQYTSKKFQGLDAQYLTIYDIERAIYEQEEDRFEQLLEWEKEEKSKKKSKS